MRVVVWPASSSALTRCWPRKPVPPVTSVCMVDYIMLVESGDPLHPLSEWGGTSRPTPASGGGETKTTPPPPPPLGGGKKKERRGRGDPPPPPGGGVPFPPLCGG